MSWKSIVPDAWNANLFHRIGKDVLKYRINLLPQKRRG